MVRQMSFVGGECPLQSNKSAEAGPTMLPLCIDNSYCWLAQWKARLVYFAWDTRLSKLRKTAVSVSVEILFFVFRDIAHQRSFGFRALGHESLGKLNHYFWKWFLPWQFIPFIGYSWNNVSNFISTSVQRATSFTNSIFLFVPWDNLTKRIFGLIIHFNAF